MNTPNFYETCSEIVGTLTPQLGSAVALPDKHQIEAFIKESHSARVVLDYCRRMAHFRPLQEQTAELDALLLSILDRAFKGEL